jgi:hypothetical protein
MAYEIGAAVIGFACLFLSIKVAVEVSEALDRKYLGKQHPRWVQPAVWGSFFLSMVVTICVAGYIM